MASAGPAILAPEIRMSMRAVYIQIDELSWMKAERARTPSVNQNTASHRVAAELRARIRSGALAPGERIPSARGITAEFGVALATAQKVLATLRREGLVRAIPGVGTVVRARGSGPELSREM